MREMGVRELKASLSQTLRSVDRGEAVRITVRGRAVADLVPTGAPPPDERLRALTAAGRLAPASRPRPDRPPPLAKASRSASALVLTERGDER